MAFGTDPPVFLREENRLMLLSQHHLADQPAMRARAQGCTAPDAARWAKEHQRPATELMGLAAWGIGDAEAAASSLEQV